MYKIKLSTSDEPIGQKFNGLELYVPQSDADSTVKKNQFFRVWQTARRLIKSFYLQQRKFS